MTPQEQQMLDGLIGRVRSAEVSSKDADADRRIQDGLGRDPNALYILCQTVLLQGYALEQAQDQIATLKEQHAQAQPPQHEPTFLEKIFGRGDPEPTQPEPQGNAPGYTRPGYGQMPQASYPNASYPPQPGYGNPYAPYGSGNSGNSGGGFLQGALQTAAGVALGEIAFESVEGLFRGFGHAAGYGSDRAMGFGDVNTGSGGDYGQGGGFFSREQAENGVNDQLSPDIEDRRGDASSGFLNSNDGGDSDAFADADDSATDSGYDIDNSTTESNGSDFSDNSLDDGGSFDTDGSFDDNI